MTFQNTKDGGQSLILSREKVGGGTEKAANENGVRLSSNTRCSKEIRQCIQNSEGEKPNYIIRLKLYQSCVREQNEHFQKTKNLITISNAFFLRKLREETWNTGTRESVTNKGPEGK